MTVLHRRDVVRVLRYSQIGLTTTELRKFFNANPRTLESCLARLLKDQDVEREFERDAEAPYGRRWCRWKAR